jgi:hypothetical protein
MIRACDDTAKEALDDIANRRVRLADPHSGDENYTGFTKLSMAIETEWSSAPTVRRK